MMTKDELKTYVLGKLDFALAHPWIVKGEDAWLVSCTRDLFSTDPEFLDKLWVAYQRPHEAEAGPVSAAVYFDRDMLEQAVQGSLPVLACFSADWCPHCRAIHPTVERLADVAAGKAIVGFVDTDQDRDLVHEYQIRGLPTCVVFRAGREAERAVGEESLAELSAMLDLHPAAPNPFTPVPES